MNQLMVGSPQQTMTSLEIADLVESRHDNVKVTIDRLVARELINRPALQDGPKAANGIVQQVYMIGKRDSYVIVAQLSPEFTARLVDRWQELESGAKLMLPDFTSPAAAARAWADEVEAKQLAQQQLAIAAPKIEFVDRYVESTSGSKGFRQVCKLLGVKEPEFRAFLHDEKIMYKLGGEWVPFAQHLDAGRFEVKAGTSETSGHAFNAAKFTAKGVEWVAGEWAKHKIKEAV